MFVICYCRDHIEWNQISNNVKPGGNFVVLDLEPATWYNVRITAHNSAGFTVAEYEFATLTVTGGIIICEKCSLFMPTPKTERAKFNGIYGKCLADGIYCEISEICMIFSRVPLTVLALNE